jgi:ABC-2 type transport system permease protein
MSLMPEWVQRLADFLPFQWTFGYPIEALVGGLSTRELFAGLGIQLLWIGIGIVFVRLVFARGVKRFSAVGN